MQIKTEKREQHGKKGDKKKEQQEEKGEELKEEKGTHNLFPLANSWFDIVKSNSLYLQKTSFETSLKYLTS